MKFDNWVDSWGLIAEGPPHRDGGDSVHRSGLINTFRFFYFQAMDSARPTRTWSLNMKSFRRAARESLMRSDGALRRHPDSTRWYGSEKARCWNRISRDAYATWMSGAASGRERELARAAVRAKRRISGSHCWTFLKSNLGYLAVIPYVFLRPVWGLLFSYNHHHNGVSPSQPEDINDPRKKWTDVLPGDLTLFSTWAIEMRAQGKAWYWLLRPWREFCDIHAALSSIHWKLFRKDDMDINTHLAQTLAGYLVAPTFISRLNARYLFPWNESKQKMWHYYAKNPSSINDMYYEFLPIRDFFVNKEWKNGRA